jgi:hypothetical protein
MLKQALAKAAELTEPPFLPCALAMETVRNFVP